MCDCSGDGDRVKFIVEDTGVGIAPDHLPHIFDRFYRVPSADPEKGLGLGLSFVSWIVKAHGGTIEVESELQQGTRFTVSLPAGLQWTARCSGNSGSARCRAGTLGTAMPQLEIQARQKEGIAILDLNGRLAVGEPSCCAKRSTRRWPRASKQRHPELERCRLHR